VIYLAIIGPKPGGQYRIAVALLCFSLSTVGGLLFATKESDIRGTVGLFTLHIAGPAVTWLAALLIFSWIFPETLMPSVQPESLASLGKLVMDADAANGWQTFSEWERRLGQLDNLFHKDYQYHVQNFLFATLDTGPRKTKLNYPTVESLFVYPPPRGRNDHRKVKAIKIQRIKSNDSEGPIDLFATAKTTTSSGTCASLLFVKEAGGAVTRAQSDVSPFWYPMKARQKDALIIASYEDEEMDGDWFQVNITKYIQNGTAVADLAVASSRPILTDTVECWLIKGSLFIQGGEIPLSFKRAPQSNLVLDIARIREDLLPWLESLDKWLQSPRGGGSDTNGAKLLERMLADLKGTGANSNRFLPDSDYISRFAYRLDKADHVASMAYLWAK